MCLYGCGDNGVVGETKAMNINQIDVNNPPDGFTVLYFTGKQKGTKTYTVGRAAYRAGNNSSGRVLLVKNEHVGGLVKYGSFTKDDPSNVVEEKAEPKAKTTRKRTTKKKTEEAS